MLVRAVISYSLLCMQLWMTTILGVGVGLVERKLQPDISVDNSETYSKANLSSALHSKSNGRAEQGNGGRSNTDSWNVTVRADQRQVLPKPAVNTVDDDIDPTIMPIDPTANSKGKKGDFPNDNGLSGQNQMDDTDSQGDDSTGDSINSQASLVADNPDSYELDPPVKTNDLQKAIQDQDLRGLEDLKDTLGSEYKSTMSYFESPDAQQQHAEGKMDESIARIDDKGHAKVVPASKFIHTHSGSDRLKIVVDVPTSNGVNDSLKEREEGSSVGIGKDNTAYKPSKLGVTKKPKGSHQSTGNQEETKGSMAYNSWPLTAQSNPSREKQASERIGDKSSNGYMSENGKVMVPPSYKHPPPDTSVVLPDDPDSIDNEDISNQKISFTLNNDGESNKRKNDQKEQEDMNNAELDFDDVLNSKIRPTPSPRDQTAHYKDHKKQGNMEAKVKGNSRASGLGEASNVSLKEGSRERRPPLLHANEAHETGINTFAAVGDNGKQVIDQEITAFEPNVSNSLNDLTPTQKGYELPLTKGNQEENAIPILTNANTAALTPAVSKEESALRYSFQVLPTISSLEVLQPQKGLGSEGKILKSSQSYMSNGLGESVTGEGGKMNEGNAVDLLGAVTSEPSRQSSEPTHASVTLKRASLPSVPPTKDLVPSAPKRSKGSVKPNVNYLDNAYVLGHANVSRDLVIRPNRREDNVSNARFLSKLKGKSDSVVSSVNRKKERSSKPSQNKTIPHRDDNQQLRIKGGKINGGIVRGGLIMGGYVDGGDIEGGSILGGKVEGGLFKSGVMENGILYNGTVEGGIIRGGKILGGKILSGIIEGGVMKGGLLEGGHLRGGYLEGGAFKGGDMEGGTLKAGEISGGILSNGSVDGGILKGGIIEGGHLLGGVMLGGRLKGGIVKSGLIRGGVIEGGVIEGGVIDEGTVIKGGIYKGNKGNGTEISGSGRSKVAYGYDYKDLQLRDITGDGSNSTSPPVDNNNILGAPESWPLKAKQGPRLEHPSYGRPPMGSPRSTGANFFPRQVKFPEPKPLLWNRKVKSKVSLSKKSFRNSKSNSPSLKVEVNTSDDKPIVKNATSDIRELLIGLEKNLGKQNGKDATRFNIPKESYRGSIIKWPLPSGLQLLAHHFTSNNPVSPYGRSQVSEANDKVSSTAVFEEPYSREIKVMSASVNKSPLNPGKDFPKSAHLHQPKEIDSTPKLPENTIETETFFQKEDRESLTESSVKSTDAKKRKKGSSRSVVTLNDKKESNWYEILGPNGEHYETLGKDITSNITQTALPKQDASLSTTQSDNSYQSDATAQQPISNNDAQSDQTPYDNQKGFKAYPSANDNSSVYNDKQSVQYGTLNNQNKNTVQSNTNTYGVAQPIPDPSYQQQETKGASASYPASKEASTTGQIADNQHSAIVDWDYDDKTASKASVFGQNGRDEMLQKEETEHDYDERRSELIPTLHWSLNKLVSERIPGDPGNPIRISGNVTIHNGIAVLAKGYLDAGDYAGECISDPEVCSDGLTVSMTIKLYKDAVASNSPMYIFDSGASSNDSRGISMWVKGYSIYASLATRFYTWCLDEKLDQFVEKWVAFVLTWRENVGMKLYTNCQLFATSEYGGQCDVCTNCHKVDKNTRLMFGRPNKGPHFRVTHFACGDISIYNHYFDEKEVVLLCGTNNDNGRIEDSTSVQKPNESALKVRHYPAIHNGMYWPTPPHYASLLDTAQNVAEAINVEPTAATPTTPFQARFRLSRPTEIQYYSEENKVFSTDQPIVSPAANQHTVVRGGYSPWSEWSRCTKSCGGGFQFSLRYCNNPMPRNGGADCGLLGPSRQTQACNERSCFIDPDLDFPSTDVPAIGIEPYRNDKRKKSGISQGVQPGKPDGIEKALEFLKM